MPELSVVLPAYNEAEVIGETVREVRRFLVELGQSFELIVGDDGSDDGTVRIVKELGFQDVRVIARPHCGKGAILTSCLTEAEGTIIGFLDADLEIPLRHLSELMDVVTGGADVGIASKAVRGRPSPDRTLSRRLATWTYNGLVRTMFGSEIGDHQAGMKLFRRERLAPVLPLIESTGWSWDTEVLIHLSRAGCQIVEVPVTTRPVRTSKVQMAGTSWQMFTELLRMRRRVRAAKTPNKSSHSAQAVL